MFGPLVRSEAVSSRLHVVSQSRVLASCWAWPARSPPASSRCICSIAPSASKWSPRCASGPDADVRTQLKHRRRIQQPWSLLLEIISLILLLLAIAGPRLGMIDSAGRDHVLILDTSAWMGCAIGFQRGSGPKARCSMKRKIPREPICARCPAATG